MWWVTGTVNGMHMLGLNSWVKGGAVHWIITRSHSWEVSGGRLVMKGCGLLCDSLG